MKRTRFTGTFKDGEQLVVYCSGFEQAVILLMAEAINLGKPYQLESVEALNLQSSKIRVKDIENLFI